MHIALFPLILFLRLLPNFSGFLLIGCFVAFASSFVLPALVFPIASFLKAGLLLSWFLVDVLFVFLSAFTSSSVLPVIVLLRPVLGCLPKFPPHIYLPALFCCACFVVCIV